MDEKESKDAAQDAKIYSSIGFASLKTWNFGFLHKHLFIPKGKLNCSGQCLFSWGCGSATMNSIYYKLQHASVLKAVAKLFSWEESWKRRGVLLEESLDIGSPECLVLARSKRSFGHITHMSPTTITNVNKVVHVAEACIRIASMQIDIIFLDFTVTQTLRSLRASWVLAAKNQQLQVAKSQSENHA